MSDIAGETGPRPSARQVFGTAGSVPEFHADAVRNCRVFGTIFDFMAAHERPANLAYVFVSDTSVARDVVARSDGEVYLAGRGLRRRGIDTVGSDSTRVHLIEGGFSAFEQTAPPPCGLVVVGPFETSRRYARMILKTALRTVAPGGYLILQRYAFWLEGRMTNSFVPVLHEIVNEDCLSVAGIVLNGNGWPDIVIEPSRPPGEATSI